MSEENKRNAGQADEIQSPRARKVKLHVQLGDELRPRRATSRDQPPFASASHLAFVAGFMVVVGDRSTCGTRSGPPTNRSCAALSATRLRVAGTHCGGDRIRRRRVRDERRIGLLPTLQLEKENRYRAAEAYDIDQRRKGEAERRVAGQHGADEVRRQKRPRFRF